MCSTLFCTFLCRCFAWLQCPFSRLKRETSWLHIFLWRNCCMCCFWSLLVFFTAAHCRFLLAAASISHFLTAATKLSCFSSNEIPASLLFIITRSSPFSVIHVIVGIKNNVEKDSTLFFGFYSLKDRLAIRFPTKNTSSVCGADKRTGLRSRDYQNFLDGWITKFS